MDIGKWDLHCEPLPVTWICKEVCSTRSRAFLNWFCSSIIIHLVQENQEEVQHKMNRCYMLSYILQKQNDNTNLWWSGSFGSFFITWTKTSHSKQLHLTSTQIAWEKEKMYTWKKKKNKKPDGCIYRSVVLSLHLLYSFLLLI